MAIEKTQVKIYYHHTDCGGVVYYSRYLDFFEEARTDFLQRHGVSVKALSDKGVLFVVSRQEVDYKSPAFYGDTLTIDTKLADISKVRLEFQCEIKRQTADTVCIGRTIMACVGSNLKPQAIPEDILKKLTV